MPFTPYHIGPVLLIYAVAIILDPIALLLGVLLPDLEPAAYLFFGIGPGHGVFHSLLGALFLSVTAYLISRVVWTGIELSRFAPSFSVPAQLFSVAGALIGTLSHVILDASVNTSKSVLFWPSLLYLNGPIPIAAAYVFCIACFFAAAAIFLVRGYRDRKGAKSE
ncbi:MAG: metal-dependent hydrolase, partial [Halobacteriota archaeon]